MIGYYNYTVILTYIGMLTGFVGIAHTMQGNLKAALICLMVSGFCDMFDGKIASTRQRTRQEKRFGIQIDSLSDLVCFGVLPAMIVLQFSGRAAFALWIAAGYLLCALIRLAWFNVDEEERQSQEGGHREIYLGLPVTSSALLLPLFWGGGQLCGLSTETISPFLLLLIALAFLTPFHLKKPKSIGKLMLLLLGAAALAVVLIGVRA